MSKKVKLKQIVSYLLTVVMLLSITVPSNSFAAEDNVVVDSTQNDNVVEEVSEEAVISSEADEVTTDTEVTEEITEDLTEAVSYDEVVSDIEEVTEEDTTDDVSIDTDTADEVTEAVTEEDITEEDNPEITEDTKVSYPFNPTEIIVEANSSAIREGDLILSEYEGLYVLGFASYEEAVMAVDYYRTVAYYVGFNEEFEVNEDETSEDTAEVTEESSEEAINEISDDTADDSEAVEDNTVSASDFDETSLDILNNVLYDGVNGNGAIALIDTGVNDSIYGSVSFLGDNGSDDNGHGTKMYDFIKEEYPSAKVISLKAMGKDGKGNVLDVYSALEYAIEHNVSIINLSLSAYATSDNVIIENKINEAIGKGIIVVCSAGNKGRDAKYFIPSRISGAIVVGACDVDGKKLTNSNFGASVDGYVYAQSTSEASARMAARILKDGLDSALETLSNGESFSVEDTFDEDNGSEYLLDEDETEKREDFLDDLEDTKKSVEDMTLTDNMLVFRIMYVDSRAKNAKNVTDVWANYSDSIIDYTYDYIPLYDDGSDYYKAYVNYYVGNYDIKNYVIGLSNSYAVGYKAANYNKDTYEISISKKAYEGKYLEDSYKYDGSEIEDYEKEVVEEMPISFEMLAVSTDDTKLGKIPVTVDNLLDGTIKEFSVENNYNDISVYVPLNIEGIDVSNLSVYVNGSEDSLDMTDNRLVNYTDGILEITVPPVTARYIKIVVHESLFEVDWSSISDGSTANALATYNGYIQMEVGQKFYGAHFYFGQSTGAANQARLATLASTYAPYIDAAYNNNYGQTSFSFWNQEIELTNWGWNGTEDDKSDFYGDRNIFNSDGSFSHTEDFCNHLIYSAAYPATDTVYYDDNSHKETRAHYNLRREGTLIIPCSDLSVSNAIPDIAYTGGSTMFYYQATCIEKTDEYIILEVQTNSINTQCGRAKFKIAYTGGSEIKVVKSSSNPSITNGNAYYSLEGAVYSVYPTYADAQNGTNAVTTIVTDASGVGISGFLSYGTYYVKETGVSMNYSYDTTIYTATLTTDHTDTNPFVINSKEIPNPMSITVNKTSSNPSYTNNNSNYSLQGAVYGVYKSVADANANTNRVNTITTNANGTGSCYVGVADHYYVKEITASKGYTLDSQVYTVNGGIAVYSGTVNSVETPIITYVKVVKKSANTTLTNNNSCYSLQGAQFGVYKSVADANNKTNAVTTLTTNASGEATSGGLPAGTYYIRELVASKGYRVNSTIFNTTTSVTDTTKTVTVEETPQDDPASVFAMKKVSDRNYYIPDCVFEVKYYAAETEAQIGTSTYRRHWYIKTDNDGFAKLDSNYLTTFNGVSSDVFYYDTSSHPTFPLGYITIQEVETPIEYLLNNTVYTYKVTDNIDTTIVHNERTIPNEDKKQAFQLIKMADDGGTELKPLANAGFMAWRTDELETDVEGNYIFDTSKAVVLTSSGAKELITDDNGYACSIPIRYGDYIVRETTTPDGYIPVNDFIVSVREDNRTAPQALRFFTDKTKKYYLRINKLDSETGNIILNNESSYKVWDYSKNAYVSYKVYANSRFVTVDTFTTADDGMLILPGTLNYGSYRLDEISSPKNYIIDSPNGIDFTIDNSTAYEVYDDEDDDTVIGIVDVFISDTAYFGRINITKKGDIRTFNEDTWEFDTSEIVLSDIDFEIYADDDIYSLDGTGTLFYSKGDLVETITTGIDGKAVSSNLPIGDYLIKEVAAPDDFIKSEDIKVSLTVDNVQMIDGYGIDIENVSISNKSYYPKVRTTALDSQTETHSGVIDKEVTIIDKVSCNDLVIGREYTISGKLYDTETQEVYLDADNNEVTAETTFTATEKDMIIDLEFTYDTSALEGETIVVFEDLLYDNKIVAIHRDIEDKEQQINYPKVRTTALDSQTETHSGVVGKEVTIIDKVLCTNLVVGDTYTVKGKLYDTETGEPYLDANKKEVVAEKTFTASIINPIVDLEFTYNTSSLEGETIVVFEDLYTNNVKIATHSDLTDLDQQINYPKVRTSAKDKVNNSH